MIGVPSSILEPQVKLSEQTVMILWLKKKIGENTNSEILCWTDWQ